MSVHQTFITLTGIPQHLSVTASVTTNSGVQQEMKSAEGKAGRVVRRLHTKYPILCSQYRQKGIHQNQQHAPSPPDFLCHPGVPDGEKGDTGSLHHCQKSRGNSHKAWQRGWNTRYIQDDRWGQWCQRDPELPPYPGKQWHVSDTCDGASDEAVLIFHGGCGVWGSSAEIQQRWMWPKGRSSSSYL